MKAKQSAMRSLLFFLFSCSSFLLSMNNKTRRLDSAFLYTQEELSKAKSNFSNTDWEKLAQVRQDQKNKENQQLEKQRRASERRRVRCFAGGCVGACVCLITKKVVTSCALL
jgi:hypothetical protein